jgi:hypothetical protein
MGAEQNRKSKVVHQRGMMPRLPKDNDSVIRAKKVNIISGR